MKEPLTIDAEVVAKFLERQRCPQMADFVRMLGGSAQRAAIREMELVRRCGELVDQLRALEPAQPESLNRETWTGD